MMGCNALLPNVGAETQVIKLEMLLIRLTIVFLFRAPFVESQACLNGVTINVDATIERQYIVSKNWAADQTSNIIGVNEFFSGGFLETSNQRAMPKAEDADCTFNITAPEGYHVKTAILAMGLLEARGELCTYYIQMDGTNQGFPGPGDGRFCASPTNGFAPDAPSSTLLYTSGPLQYVNYLPDPYNSSTRILNQPVIQCSENRSVSVQYINEFINQDEKYIGFVMSFRAVKGRYCGLCDTTTPTGQQCEFDSSGVLPSYTEDTLTHQCTTDIGVGQSQPSCYYKDASDDLQVGVCDLTNTNCAEECISSDTGDSCIFPFTLQGTTFTACIEGTAVNASIYTSTDYLCPVQYNAASDEYFDFKLCGGIRGSCLTDNVPSCFYNPCQNGATCQEANGNAFGYTCDCSTASGYVGQNCSVVDPCSSDPCNGGICSVNGSDAQGFGFECNCSTVPDFLGETCSISNPCGPSIDPCNGGICSLTGSEAEGFGFQCNCSNVPNFLGDTCSISNPCGPSNDPCNGGVCTVTGDVVNGFGSQCDCSNVPDQLGDTCQLDNPCLPDPCSGGVCEITGDQQAGFDYACNCSSVLLFVGRNCTTIDPCTNPENPCNTYPCTTTESNGVFTASCSCPAEGTVGDLCHADPCYPNTCNGGNCTVTGNQADGYGFECNCSIVPDQLGDTCQLANPCLPDPCSGGICEITGDQQAGFDYACNCSSVTLFVGRNCTTIDPCTNPENPCNTYPCTTIENNGVFTANCSCPAEGTVGDFCDPDPCVSNPCNLGTCQPTLNNNGVYEPNCTCPDGYSGDRCEILDNPCNNFPCQNDGTCIPGNTSEDFTCVCKSPWFGPLCTVIDECASEDPCLNNGLCFTRSNGSYFCKCINNWAGENCTLHPNIFVQCGTISMVIYIEKSVVSQLKHPTEFLHVIDRNCQFVDGTNDSYYVKEINFQECGTDVITINEQSVTFCQRVRASTFGGQFISGLTALLQCNLRVTESKVVSFLPGMQSNALETEAKVDLFPLSLKSYNASALSGAFAENTHAVEVETNEPVYMGVITTAFHKDTSLILQECWASRDNNSRTQTRYTLLRDFCPADSSFQVTKSEDKAVYFEFLSFRFVDDIHLDNPEYDTVVYIHCHAYLCQAGATNCSNTTEICNSRSSQGSKRSRRHITPDPTSEKSRTLVASFGPVISKTVIKPLEIDRYNPNSRFSGNFNLAMKVYRYYLTDNLLYVLSFMTLVMLMITFFTHCASNGTAIFRRAIAENP